MTFTLALQITTIALALFAAGHFVVARQTASRFITTMTAACALVVFGWTLLSPNTALGLTETGRNLICRIAPGMQMPDENGTYELKPPLPLCL